MNDTFQMEVRQKLAGQHHLHALFGSVYAIPERLFEYNNALFICFNSETQNYEIHSLEQPVSFAAVLPYKELDARTLRYVWNNDLRVHGRAIFDRIEQGEEAAKKQKDRDFHNWAESVAKETQSLFAKDAWA